MNSLCQKALHIVTELCFAGQVEWEKCSGIFPRDRGSQGGGSTGNRGGEGRVPEAPRSRPRAPLLAPSSVPPRRAGGTVRTQRLLPTWLLSGYPGCGLCLRCCLPISTRPAPSSTSQLCPLPAAGSRAPAPPRLALPRPRLPPGAQRLALGLLRGDRSPGGTRAARPGPVPRAPGFGGRGLAHPCLDAKNCLAQGAGRLGLGRQRASWKG